jgi:hypothetical protein
MRKKFLRFLENWELIEKEEVDDESSSVGPYVAM